MLSGGDHPQEPGYGAGLAAPNSVWKGIFEARDLARILGDGRLFRAAETGLSHVSRAKATESQ